MKQIIEKAKELADKEVDKAIRPLFSFADEIGQKLGEKLNADKNIVLLGTLLMDIKLNQAKKEGRPQEHTTMGLEATKEFLTQFNLDEEIKNKIYNCVEAHHGKVPFNCIEAEICCNADCYKFIHPKGVFLFFRTMKDWGMDFIEAVKFAQDKMEEKYKLISLDICKEELEQDYQMFKKLLKDAE